MAGALLFIGLISLLLLGVPIAISLGFSSLAFITLVTDDPATIGAQKLVDTMEHTTLLASPFFVLSSILPSPPNRLALSSK